MEESLQRLKNFLTQISHIETEADEYRTKIMAIPGGKRKIFLAIDRDCVGQISSLDICMLYCQQKKGVFAGKQIQEIVGRYFKNWGEGITYDQFVEVMKPKVMACQFGEQQVQDPITIFSQMVSTVIKSFQNLEVLRSQLCQYHDSIIKHFSQNYGSKNGLTKQQLKKFMIDQNMFTKLKYCQIYEYIFGDFENQIPWKYLFGQTYDREKKKNNTKNNKNQIKDKSKKKIRIALEDGQAEVNGKEYCSIYSHQVLKQQTPKQQERKLFNPKDCNNINEVLDQIQQIQKYLKQKRTKINNRSLPQSPKKGKQTFIGYIKRRQTQRQQHQKEQQQNLLIQTKSQIKKPKSKSKIRLDDSLYNSKYQDQQNLKYQQYGHNTLPNQKKLKRGVSQAQLKIDQIQRRAMDKYLSSRKQTYLPNDSHIQYFYGDRRENMEYLRQRSLERSNKKVDRLLYGDGGYSPIYTRNKVSRLMQMEHGFLQRPISPHILRY